MGMGEVEGIVEFGERFNGVMEFTGIGDLFCIVGVVLLPPREEVEAELNAGLGFWGLLKTPNVLAGAGVLIKVGAIDVLGSTGLRLQVLLRIGVSLEFMRTGASCQLGPTWLMLLLFILLFIFVSSKELSLLAALGKKEDLV